MVWSLANWEPLYKLCPWESIYRLWHWIEKFRRPCISFILRPFSINFQSMFPFFDSESLLTDPGCYFHAKPQKTTSSWNLRTSSSMTFNHAWYGTTQLQFLSPTLFSKFSDSISPAHHSPMIDSSTLLHSIQIEIGVTSIPANCQTSSDFMQSFWISPIISWLIIMTTKAFQIFYSIDDISCHKFIKKETKKDLELKGS